LFLVLDVEYDAGNMAHEVIGNKNSGILVIKLGYRLLF
jgi:hypothetical protein